MEADNSNPKPNQTVKIIDDNENIINDEPSPESQQQEYLQDLFRHKESGRSIFIGLGILGLVAIKLTPTIIICYHILWVITNVGPEFFDSANNSIFIFTAANLFIGLAFIILSIFLLVTGTKALKSYIAKASSELQPLFKSRAATYIISTIIFIILVLFISTYITLTQSSSDSITYLLEL